MLGKITRQNLIDYGFDLQKETPIRIPALKALKGHYPLTRELIGMEFSTVAESLAVTLLYKASEAMTAIRKAYCQGLVQGRVMALL